MQNLKAQVFFLTNVKVAALNNAGKNKASRNDNAIATKKVYIDGNAFPYMAGQAYGRALRDTLQRVFSWQMAPILRGEKTAVMLANPFLYPDADMFGYLNAEKTQEVDESTGEVKKDSKNQDKMVDTTVNRRAPVSKKALRSIGPVHIARHFSVMARQEGDPVPYQKEEYAGCLEGGICVDCFSAGTFSSYNKTGYKNITQPMVEQALAVGNGCTLIDDPYELNDKGLPQKLVRLPKEMRIQRITDVIQAPRFISGGAMQTNNMEDITYDFAIFYSLASGNHLFGNIMSERPESTKEEIQHAEVDPAVQRFYFNKSRIILNVPAILEELRDYRHQLLGTVFIGKRAGFLDEYNEALQQLIETTDSNRLNYPPVKLGSIGDMCDQYCEQLKTQIQ